MGLKESYYTPKEVAEFLNLQVATVHKYIRAGKIKAAMFGRYYRISPEALREFLESVHGAAQLAREHKKKRSKRRR